MCTTLYSKVDRYFFPEDTSVLFSSSIVAPFNTYRLTRFVLCALLVSGCIWNETTFTRNELLLQAVYLTEWSLLLTLLYFLLATADLLSYRFRARTIWKGAWKVQTVLFVTAFVDEFVVTLMFWLSLIFYSSKDTINIPLHIAVHLLPLIALYIDGMMNPIIVKNWRPMIYVLLIDGAYFIVNLIYSLIQRPVYAQINYKDVMSYVYIASFFLLASLQFVIYKELMVKKVKLVKAEKKMDNHKQSVLEDWTETGTNY